MSISFNEEMAAKYGLNVIIFCSKIADWLRYNKANEQNFYDGKYWTYNTLKALTRLFPFWTVDQIRKVIKESIEAQLIVRGNYNKKGFDQTLWYTLTDLGLNLFKIPMWEIPQMDVVKSPNGCGEIPTPIPIKSTNKIKPEREPEKEPLSVDNFKNEETLNLCKSKHLVFEKELEKFKNYYQGKEISLGKFKNWLDRAKQETPPSQKKSNCNESKQKAKFWGPGHETWDRLYA